MICTIFFFLSFIILGYLTYKLAKFHQLDSELINQNLFSTKEKIEKLSIVSKKIIKKFRLYLFFIIITFIILEMTIEGTFSFLNFGIK